MPDPRPLGTVAKNLLAELEGLLVNNADEFFTISVLIQENRVPDAIRALKELAARDNLALRVLTLMRADQLKEADEAIIDAKLKKR